MSDGLPLPDARPAGGAGAWTSGLFLGDAHLFPVRVYFEDTDAGGIVYHANYLRFAERARTEMLRLAGAPHARQMSETGVAFAVRHCAADFLRPARLEESLAVVTRVTRVGGATATLVQTIRRLPDGVGLEAAEDGEELVRLSFKLACITADGRPARVPAAARTALCRHQAALGREDQDDRPTAGPVPVNRLSVNRHAAGGEQE